MEEVSLREVIEAILKGKWIIIGITILCLLAGFFGTSIFTAFDSQVQIIIALNYTGVEKGLNPDKTKFDINILTAPIVLAKAMEEAGIEGNTITDIKKNIEIKPIIPNAIGEKIEATRTKGEDYTFYPNEYVMTYKIPKKSGISESEGRQLLTYMVSAYEQYFFELYFEKTVLANAVGSLDYKAYDYPEVSLVMRSQIDIIDDYLNKKTIEAKDFRSKKTGYSFADLKESVKIVDSVDINRMDSLIGAYNLTKDSEKLIINYENRIKQLELEKVKKESEAQTAREMMDSFKREQNMVMLPGGIEDSMQIDSGNSYYDKLAKRSTEAGVKANNIQHDINYFKSEIDRIKTDAIPKAEKDEAVADVVVLVEGVREKLNLWIDTINETTFEYYDYRLGTQIMTLSPAETSSVTNKLMNLAISAVLGVMLGVFIVLFMQYWKDSENDINRVGVISDETSKIK